eukprot:scaffold16501_cov37-Prasinocladus_malaysianus.AAC.2
MVQANLHAAHHRLRVEVRVERNSRLIFAHNHPHKPIELLGSLVERPIILSIYDVSHEGLRAGVSGLVEKGRQEADVRVPDPHHPQCGRPAEDPPLLFDVGQPEGLRAMDVVVGFGQLLPLLTSLCPVQQ